MSVVGAADGEAAIAGGANRNVAGSLVADVPVHVGVNNVLPRCVELRKSLAKVLPVLRNIDVEKRHAQSIVERPAQSHLPRLTRNYFGNYGPMTGNLYVEHDIRFCFDVNHFFAMFRLLPALRRLICTVRVKIFDERIGYGGANVGESPRNALIVANDYVRHSGQSHPGDIQAAGLQMSLIPQIRHLMPKVHIV